MALLGNPTLEAWPEFGIKFSLAVLPLILRQIGTGRHFYPPPDPASVWTETPHGTESDRWSGVAAVAAARTNSYR
jgi:hypothetical protein